MLQLWLRRSPTSRPPASEPPGAPADVRRSTTRRRRPLPPIRDNRPQEWPSRSGHGLRVDQELLGDSHAICSCLFPFLEFQSIGLAQCPDPPDPPVENLVQQGNHDAERVVAENGAVRNPRQLLILGDRDGEPFAAVDVKHDMDVRAPVAHINSAIGRGPKSSLHLFYYGDVAVTGGYAADRPHFPRSRVKIQFGAVNVVRRHDASQRRRDDLAGRRGYDEERKAVPIDTPAQEVNQSRNRALESNTAPRLDQVLVANTAEFRVVADEIREFSALLHQIAAGQASDSIVKS